jgi:hypothetical protein
MRIRTQIAAACLCIALAPAALWAQGTAKPADKAKPAASATPAKPATDAQAMQEMMAKMTAPGPNHELFKKLAGEWTCTVKTMMDPSQPPVVTQSTAVVTTLMGGRYSQEQVSGTMMGQPFSGMGLTGYDNIQKV